jgi:hypothetical protein
MPSVVPRPEWRGRKIGVVMRVPLSLRTKFGNNLRKTVDTDNPKLADVLEYATLQELKAKLYRAKHGTNDDPLIRDALLMRKVLEVTKSLPLPEIGCELPHHDTLELVASDLAQEIGKREGGARAEIFIGIAHGVAHPIMLFVEEWIVASQFAPKIIPSMRKSIVRLDKWAKAQDDIPQVLESIKPRIVSRYAEEAFEKPRVLPTTANQLLSGLSSYRKWLLKTNRLDPDKYRNPWPSIRVANKKSYLASCWIDGVGVKLISLVFRT